MLIALFRRALCQSASGVQLISVAPIYIFVCVCLCVFVCVSRKLLILRSPYTYRISFLQSGYHHRTSHRTGDESNIYGCHAAQVQKVDYQALSFQCECHISSSRTISKTLGVATCALQVYGTVMSYMLGIHSQCSRIFKSSYTFLCALIQKI